MGRRILLLGDTGKLGRALRAAFDAGDEVVGANSRTFDACDFDATERLVRDVRPDRIYNAVAMLGVDPCERDPARALRLNALFPQLLARLASAGGFGLVHFGTDAVFDGPGGEPFAEGDAPCPPNVYGLTKFGGDAFVLAEAPRAFVFRVSLLFGPTDRRDQFVEKMVAKAIAGEGPLRASDDIVLSPTFSTDAARAAVSLVEGGGSPGLYHLANAGRASLHDLLVRIAAGLGLPVRIEKASHRDFPSIGKKNRFTPIRSERIPPLRRWEDAVDAYCRLLTTKGTTPHG